MTAQLADVEGENTMGLSGKDINE